MKSRASSFQPEAAKLEIIQWVAMLQDDSILERLQLIKNNPEGDWWDEISEAEKDTIDKGLNDIKEGKLKTHIEAKKLYEKWL